MKCISIKQPWAAAIIFCGKDIENRDWLTGYRGPVLIHAGKTDDFDLSNTMMRGTFEAVHGITLPEHIDRGGIVGIAEIVDCVTWSPSRWFQGRYGFVLRNAKPLPFTPYRGQLGLFDVPDEIARQLGVAL